MVDYRINCGVDNFISLVCLDDIRVLNIDIAIAVLFLIHTDLHASINLFNKGLNNWLIYKLSVHVSYVWII